MKNYTGDVMNFQMAAELAADEGIAVATVLVDDDVAVENSTWTAGRRGTGATCSWRRSPARSPSPGRRSPTSPRSASGSMPRRLFAVALTACTTPAAGKPGFDLPEDEIEVGVGIHGEPGRRREKLRPA